MKDQERIKVLKEENKRLRKALYDLRYEFSLYSTVLFQSQRLWKMLDNIPSHPDMLDPKVMPPEDLRQG